MGPVTWKTQNFLSQQKIKSCRQLIKTQTWSSKRKIVAAKKKTSFCFKTSLAEFRQNPAHYFMEMLLSSHLFQFGCIGEFMPSIQLLLPSSWLSSPLFPLG